MIYAAFFSLFIFSSIAEIIGLKKTTDKTILCFLVTVIILFVGLRYKTGADWSGYIRVFENSDSYSENSFGTEYGYFLLNRIYKYIFGDYFALQFSVTFFVCLVVYKFVAKYSAYPIFSLFLFIAFFLNDILMAQVRQSIALAIILLSSGYIFNRKLIKFLLAVFIACFFHISAVFAIPLYFLYCKIHKAFLLILLLGSQLFYFNNHFLTLLIEALMPFLPGRLAIIVPMYLNSEIFAGQAAFNTGLSHIGSIFIAFFFVFIVNPKDTRTSFYINTVAIAMIIKSMSSGFSIISRLTAYYLVYNIIAYTYLFVPSIFRKQKDFKYIYVCCFIILFALVPIKSRLTHGINRLSGRDIQYGWIPYYNVLYHPYEAKSRKDWNE
jgi:hypothetical protein